MRIAQVAPLYESVPPKLYGGTERVVSYLTEELVRQGHEVTLFASGDSVTAARKVSPCNRSLRFNRSCADHLVHHLLLLERVFQDANEFDIIHFHCDYLHFPLSRRHPQPNITTLHGRLDLPDLIPLYREFIEVPVVSISDSQRRPLPWLNWQRTIYHGLPLNLYRLFPKGGEYLAFAGRISPEKGLDRAIEIAKRAGIKLRIAAKVDRADVQYFREAIQPLLDHPLVEFLGEIGEGEKNEFFGNAAALLVPVDWPEPFGLVMIEALACGTPVIGWNRGSVPEVIDDGESGFVVQTLEEAVGAIEGIHQLSRDKCRDIFERRFSVSRMTSDYLYAYGELIETMAEPGVAHNGCGRRNPHKGTVLHPFDFLSG